MQACGTISIYVIEDPMGYVQEISEVRGKMG